MTASTGDSREQQEPADIATKRGAIPADTFAARLILTRHHNGHLSIREAADVCGLGRGAWTNWERGARPSDVQIYTIIADKLKMDLEWLMFGGDLLPARGRPVKRPSRSTDRYSRVALCPAKTGTNGLTRTGATTQPVRRSNVIVRSHPAAA
jgi:hypothetical protein